MDYQHLSKQYKYKVLADNLLAREIEHFHYQFDLLNFRHIIAATEDQAYKDELEKRCVEICVHMERVEQVIAALKSHVDDEALLHSACVRRDQDVPRSE